MIVDPARKRRYPTGCGPRSIRLAGKIEAITICNVTAEYGLSWSMAERAPPISMWRGFCFRGTLQALRSLPSIPSIPSTGQVGVAGHRTGDVLSADGLLRERL